jgi:hypothetical protein
MEQFGFFKDRPPVLLIGSGISKRYLENYPSWEELLEETAERMGITGRKLKPYKSSAKEDNDFGYFPKLATELDHFLVRSLKEEIIVPETLFDDEELIQYDHDVNPFKILISSKFRTYRLKEDKDLLSELDSFRKLINTIPSVITTNYDSFLEEKVFNGYKVYSRISDYYFSDSEGIGEVFKIHGTASEPDGIVITEKDYSNYIKNSKIVTAKILSLLCDYPLLILGYSLEDDDVKQIITDLMGSLNQEKLKQVEQNIVFIKHSEGKMDFKESINSFELGEKRFSLHTVETDNFKQIFDDISMIVPSTTSSQVRRFRQLVKNLVITSDPNQQQLLYIGAVDFDDKDLKDVVLIAADNTQMTRVLSEFTSCDALVRDVLFNNISMDPNTVLTAFENKKLFKNTEYVPIYPYYSKSAIKTMSPRLKEYFQSKETQYPLERIRKEGSQSGITDLSQLGQVKTYRIPLLIVYLFDKQMITSDQALNELKCRYNQLCADVNAKSNMKMAVCYIMSKLHPVTFD